MSGSVHVKSLLFAAFCFDAFFSADSRSLTGESILRTQTNTASLV